MRRLRDLLFIVCLLLVFQTHAAMFALAHILPGASAPSSTADAILPRAGTAQELTELRCRGAKDALVDAYVIDKLDADTLSLNFNTSSRAAGADSKGLDPGTCSWIDRTVKEDEWRQIHFQVTAEQAQSIPAYLKNPDNYWSFFVVSSAQGFFDAKRHQAWTTAIKPETPAASSPPVSQPNAPAAAPPPVSQPNAPPALFGGKWNMLAGFGGTPFNLTLQQTGNNVSGTFSPQDGTIEGTVTGKTLRFQWTQAGGYKGTGVMEIDADEKFLSGVFTTIEGPKKGENRVSATRVEAQPSSPPASFAGTWDTVAAREYKYTMKLEQTGDKVTGTFAPGSGKLEGTVQANILRLHFTQNPKLKGSARLTLASDGKSFSGTTNGGDDPDAIGQDWTGSRQTTSTSTSTTPPASFTGTWEMVANGTNKSVLVLKQAGDKVTGTFDPGNGKIENGVVEGKVLNFEWTQDGGYVGAGRWDMGANGRSFSGDMYIFEGPAKGAVPTTATRNIRLRVP